MAEVVEVMDEALTRRPKALFGQYLPAFY